MNGNLSTTIWGPSLWRVLHSFSFAIQNSTPENIKQRNEFIAFVESLKTMLPCEECRLHFVDYLENNSPRHASNLALWTFNFHNEVNKRLGKPQFSFEDVSQVYQGADAHCDMHCATKHLKSNEKVDMGVLLFLILVLCVSTALVFLFKQQSK